MGSQTTISVVGRSSGVKLTIPFSCGLISCEVIGVSAGGIHLRRDNPASVRYAKELDSNKSSATLQRTDRHGILGQKPCDFQLPLWQRQAKHSTTGPSQRVFQE